MCGRCFQSLTDLRLNVCCACGYDGTIQALLAEGKMSWTLDKLKTSTIDKLRGLGLIVYLNTCILIFYHRSRYGCKNLHSTEISSQS
jgi:hypothetical protein